ncbi:MAG: hypothetical protein DDT19_02116 [Syntrophomonadaceae bacterium]|nr:hypothetical protein [Bacillota bacterium]
MALLTVSGFPSGRIVHVRVFNFTTSTEVVPWTSIGVSERADGQGFSTYFFKFALIAENEYIVDWRDNSTPVNTASEGISVLHNSKTGYFLSPAGVDAILDDAPHAELTTVPTSMGTLRQMVQFIFQYLRNRRTATSTTETLFREDATTPLGTAPLTSDGVTRSKGVMR